MKLSDAYKYPEVWNDDPYMGSPEENALSIGMRIDAEYRKKNEATYKGPLKRSEIVAMFGYPPYYLMRAFEQNPLMVVVKFGNVRQLWADVDGYECIVDNLKRWPTAGHEVNAVDFLTYIEDVGLSPDVAEYLHVQGQKQGLDLFQEWADAKERRP